MAAEKIESPKAPTLGTGPATPADTRPIKLPGLPVPTWEGMKFWNEPSKEDLENYYNYLQGQTNSFWQPLTNVQPALFKKPSYMVWEELLTESETNVLRHLLLERVRGSQGLSSREEVKDAIIKWNRFLRGSDGNMVVKTGAAGQEKTEKIVLVFNRLNQEFEKLLNPRDLGQKFPLMTLGYQTESGQDAFIDLLAVLCRLAEKYSLVAGNRNRDQAGLGNADLEKAIQLLYFLNGENFQDSELAKKKIIVPDDAIGFYGNKLNEMASPVTRAVAQNLEKTRAWIKILETLMEDRRETLAELPWPVTFWKRSERLAGLKDLQDNQKKLETAYEQAVRSMGILRDILSGKTAPGSLPDRETILKEVFAHLDRGETGISYSTSRIRAQLGGTLKALAENCRIQADHLQNTQPRESAKLREKARAIYAESLKYLDRAFTPDALQAKRLKYFDYVPMAFLDWAEASLETAAELQKSGTEAEKSKAGELAQKVLTTFNRKMKLPDPNIFIYYNDDNFSGSGVLHDNVLARILSQVSHGDRDEGDADASAVLRFLRVLYRSQKLVNAAAQPEPAGVAQEGKYRQALQNFVFGRWETSLDGIKTVLIELTEGMPAEKIGVFNSFIDSKFFQASQLGGPKEISKLKNMVIGDVISDGIPEIPAANNDPLEITTGLSEKLAEVLKNAQAHQTLFRQAGRSPADQSQPSKIKVEEIPGAAEAAGKFHVTISPDLTWTEFILLFGREFSLRNKGSLYPLGTKAYSSKEFIEGKPEKTDLLSFSEEIVKTPDSDQKFWNELYDYVEKNWPLSRLGAKPLIQVTKMEKELAAAEKETDLTRKIQIYERVEKFPPLDSDRLAPPFFEYSREFEIDLSQLDVGKAQDVLKSLKTSYARGRAEVFSLETTDLPGNKIKLRLTARGKIVPMDVPDYLKMMFKHLGLQKEIGEFLAEVEERVGARQDELGEFAVYSYAVDYLWLILPRYNLSSENLQDLEKRYANAKFYAAFSLIGAHLDPIPSSESELSEGFSKQIPDFTPAAQAAIKGVAGISFDPLTKQLTVKAELQEDKLVELLKNGEVKKHEVAINGLFRLARTFKTKENVFEQLKKVRKEWTDFLANNGVKIENNKAVLLPEAGPASSSLTLTASQMADIERQSAWLALKTFSVVMSFEFGDEKKVGENLESDKLSVEAGKKVRVEVPPRSIAPQASKPLDYILYGYLYDLSVNIPQLSPEEKEKVLAEIKNSINSLSDEKVLEAKLKDRRMSDKIVIDDTNYSVELLSSGTYEASKFSKTGPASWEKIQFSSLPELIGKISPKELEIISQLSQSIPSVEAKDVSRLVKEYKRSFGNIKKIIDEMEKDSTQNTKKFFE